MDKEKETARLEEDEQFEGKTRKIDRMLIGVLVDVAVSVCTTLFILSKLGYQVKRCESQRVTKVVIAEIMIGTNTEVSKNRPKSDRAACVLRRPS